MAVLWMTDPWSTLDHPKDTTLRLMEESILLGIPTYWLDLDLLEQSSANLIVAKQLLTVKPGRSADSFIFEAPTQFKASIFRQAHFRVDPPVNESYFRSLRLLETALNQSCPILNDPHLIRTQSEKVPPQSLWDYCPEFKVVENKADSIQAAEIFQNKAFVLKPLNTAQSVGVVQSPPLASRELESFLVKKTNGFVTPILVQEFLPQINQGETRIWFVHGAVLGCLKKYPKDGDFRVLIDQGSRITAVELSAEQKIISEKIGQALKSQNASLAAVDLIENKISDYNITSPGLLVQMEQVLNQNLAKKALELLGLTDQGRESSS